jgi:hypothetical protein
MYPLRDVFDVFLMSSLMSHEERLGVLEKDAEGFDEG